MISYILFDVPLLVVSLTNPSHHGKITNILNKTIHFVRFQVALVTVSVVVAKVKIQLAMVKMLVIRREIRTLMVILIVHFCNKK